MEKSRLDYSKYRIEKAEKELRIAKSLFNDEEFEASINRSYYAIFHALRSVNDKVVPGNSLGRRSELNVRED